MKSVDLIKLGFKKELSDDRKSHWYSKSIEEHHFITNDTSFNNDTDEWCIGYQNSETNEDFWFNNNLTTPKEYRFLKRMLIGY